MSNRDYYNDQTRPKHRKREPSYYSDSETDSSDYSESEDEAPKPRRTATVPRYADSKKATAMTKPTTKSHQRKAVSDTEDRRPRRHRSRYSDSESSSDSDDYSSSDSDSDDSDASKNQGDMAVAKADPNKPPKTKLERKVNEILDALGLLHIKNDPSRRQLASPDPEKYAKQKQALQAAVTAAAIEAWRSRSKPGGFNMQKAVRIVMAAIAAGGVDVLVDGRPGHDNMRDLAEAVIGGLATSKALGGKITHRREGGAQGKMIDGFIALAASKMVKPPKPDEVEQRKQAMGKRSKSLEPSRHRSRR